MAILDIMEIGKQGLTANKQALQTSSHNIANANTPGYTRQKPIFQTNAQSVTGNSSRVGGGVNIKAVIRVHDSFVNNQIMEESKTLGASKTKSEMMRRLESIVHHDGFRPGEIVNRFFSSVRELAGNAEAPAVKNAMLNSAKVAASDFRTLNNSLYTLEKEIDGRVEATLTQVNALTKELAGLNESIRTQEAVGNSPLEHLDRRDAILRELSEKLGFQTLPDDQNNANIAAGGLGIIVHGNHYNELSVVRTAERDDKNAGAVDIVIHEGNNTRKVTQAFTSGELGGLLYVRDQILKPSRDQLDVISYQFANQVNAAHREGAGADGLTGRNLFNTLEGPKGSADALEISQDVEGQLDHVAVGFSADLPGDNRVALKIADIQNEKILPSGGTSAEADPGITLNDGLNNWVGNIASNTQQEDHLRRHQESIVNQLENYRQSIAGVSLEEEAVNMFQYQAVFNASAKAMKIGDELFQTILNIRP